MQAHRVLLLLISLSCCTNSHATIQLPPLNSANQFNDKNLLFLSEEEPPIKDSKVLLAENQVLTSPGLTSIANTSNSVSPSQKTAEADVPKKEKKASAKSVKREETRVPLPRKLFKHQKIEDVESRAILSPVFNLKKRNGELTLSGKYRPELAYGKNTNLFNGCDTFDRYFAIKHTIDVTFDAKCGPQKYDYNASQLKFTLRNKGVWGNYAFIAPTSESTVKDIDASFGAHKHFIGRHVVWIREVWMKTLLNAALDLDANYKQYLTVGYFPFQLGHGVALGDAYAVNPGLLGFYTENVIDQFAPGIRVSGELIKDSLVYDVYLAILENKSVSLATNSEPIYLQRYGRRNCPERGFGSIDWLIAGRFEWVALRSKEYGTLELQPYILYNRAPEQLIEFVGDGASHLATAGFSADYKNQGFECSFEAARNFGSQDVFGWDRNRIITELDSTTAVVRHVNSHVVNAGTTNKALDIKANQAVINASTQSALMNGKLIGSGLQNADNRFSDPYCTPFRGWMAIVDAGYWLLDRQLQVAVAGGIATGDENPNVNLDDPKSTPGDGSFDGFIGLQEIFSGSRVESAFFLGQRISRPLSLPNDSLSSGYFASSVNGFTNIVYTGAGVHVKPNWERKPYFRSNLLFFWQETATRAFDCSTKQRSLSDARNFLGTELNGFFNMTFAECIGATVVASVFVPGGHYSDIKGTPLNSAQAKLLLSETPDVASQFLLSTDPAFFFNFVLEYRF